MAEEVQTTEKSWIPNLGILSDSSLQGLKPEVQDQLQRDATKRMLLGGLLSGGNFGMAFQSAVGVPTDYFARQQQILTQQQQAERDRAVASAYQPTRGPFNQDSQQAAALAEQLRGLSPEDVKYESGRIVNTAMGVVPREFNPAAYMTNALPVIARSDPTKMAEALKSMRPFTVEAGAQLRDPFTGRVTGYAPGSVEKGQQIQFDPTTGQEKVVDLPGAVESISRRALAEKGAAAKFELKPVVENGQEVLRTVYDLANPEQKASLERAQGDVAALEREISLTKPTETNRLAILNQELQKAQGQVTSLGGTVKAPVSKLSAPEAAYQQSWEKAEKSARTGYEQSKKNAVALQSLQNIFNRPDFGTNAFTGYKSQIISVLQPLGLSTEQQNRFLTSSTSARQALNDFAVNNVSELSGATSDRDIVFGKERFATLTDPTSASRYAIDLMEATNNRKKAYFDFVQNNRSNDVEQKWAQSPEGSASIFESQKMRKYLPSSVIQSGEYKGQTAYKMPDGTVKVFPK